MEFIITANVQLGFEEGMKKLKNLAKQKIVTPWHSYSVISKEEINL
ncbi:hypothetical protein [Natranaerobius trueperi]|nr:hypothetical protein [Natranaerobius trueperi]